MPIVERARDSPLSFSPNHNHNVGLAAWALRVKEAGLKRKPFISLGEMAEFLPNDPENRDILWLMTATIMNARRPKPEEPELKPKPNPEKKPKKKPEKEPEKKFQFEPKPYLAAQNLRAGFWVGEEGKERISAPLACNISFRHLSAPFAFEVWEGGKFQKRMFVTIVGGRMEIDGGDRKEILS